MKHTRTNVMVLFAILVMIAITGISYADTGVKAVPEIQGLTTGTSSNVVGTVTETDSGAWSLTNDPLVIYTYNLAGDDEIPLLLDDFNAGQAQLQAAGSVVGTPDEFGNVDVTRIQCPPVAHELANKQPDTWRDSAA